MVTKPEKEKPRPSLIRWGFCVADGIGPFEGAFMSRDEAVAAGRKSAAGADFWISHGEMCEPADFVPMSHDILEMMAEHAGEIVDYESLDGWPDVTQEATMELDDFMARWARQHAGPCRFWRGTGDAEMIDGE